MEAGIVSVVIAVTWPAYVVAATVVTPDSMSGWWFFQETPTGSGVLVSGPSTPPEGTGSAELTVNGTGGVIFGTFEFVGTRLDEITSLLYSTYRSIGTDALAPSLQLDIDTDVTDANTAWQGRLVYEPYYTHAVSTGVWQTWNPQDNAGAGNWWFSGAPGNGLCPISNACTWAELLTIYPNAGIRSAGANTGATQFKAGGGWAGGFVGNVDSFSIGIVDTDVAYNFELVPPPATLRVVKSIVNANSGTATPSDFTVHVKDAVSTSDVSGSPAAGTSTPGTMYTLPAGTYTVSEDGDPLYTQSFGGDCVPDGSVTLAPGDDKICTIINTDIPQLEPVAPSSSGGGGSSRIPLISVTKIPSPLTLPDGPGSVTYTYTVANVGRISMSDVSVKDDTCNPATFVSGDSDNDTRLDIDETWIYHCTKVVSATETNTATAHGSANNRDAYAVAVATVVVGISIPGLPDTGLVPPLINLIKVPSRLTPLPFGGGDIMYTYTVTNPGAVPLHGVVVTDDKCAPVNGPFTQSDENDDHLLDPNETWFYTCRASVSVSTRNIATALGKANDLIALSHAFVDTLVSPPGLPDTGSFLSEDQVIVRWTSLNVRKSPSLESPILGQAPTHAQGTITDVSVTKDGYTWVPVQYKNGLTGWSATAGLSASYRFKAGDMVLLTREMNVRRGAGLGQTIMSVEVRGKSGLLLSGPIEKDGYLWWQIQYGSGVTGWIAEVGLMGAP